LARGGWCLLSAWLVDGLTRTAGPCSRCQRRNVRPECRRLSVQLSVLRLQLTSCVKPDLYVCEGDAHAGRLKGWGRWDLGQARGETSRRTEGSDGDARVRVSRAADAPSPARTLAVQAVALSSRSPLAGAGAVPGLLVRERTGALGAGPARVQPPATGELRDQQGPGRCLSLPTGPPRGRAGRGRFAIAGGDVGAQ
jgi:hypothetical protein